jgi:molybdate transport system regulatory protein
MAQPPAIKLKLQLYSGSEIAMGPGKADLLEAIGRAGSISAAGRALGLSYRRAWQLVDTMNRCWSAPLVETRPGSARGGARVTTLGLEVLAAYRGLQAAAEDAARGPLAECLVPHLRAEPRSAD